MTTDEQEGRRQAEAMKPAQPKVGGKVRLAAGGERIMTVVDLRDYDNMAVCEWQLPGSEPGVMDGATVRDAFPVSSLVRVD